MRSLLGVGTIPKILVSLRLDADLVKKLSKRAESLGIGLTVLLRRYIEAMAVQDEAGLGRPVHIPRDEFSFLVEAVVACGKKEVYAEIMSKFLEVSLRWRFGDLDLPPGVILKEALSLLSIQNKILEFKVRSDGSSAVASFTAVNRTVGDAVSASIIKLLNSVGARVSARSAGTTYLVEVREK